MFCKDFSVSSSSNYLTSEKDSIIGVGGGWRVDQEVRYLRNILSKFSCTDCLDTNSLTDG